MLTRSLALCCCYLYIIVQTKLGNNILHTVCDNILLYYYYFISWAKKLHTEVLDIILNAREGKKIKIK